MRFQYFFLLLFTITLTSHAQSNPVPSTSYSIRYCGSGPNSRANDLQALLRSFQRKLQLVVADARKGTNSAAFRAFFKHSSNAAYVQDVFEHMAKGQPAVIPGKGPGGKIRLQNPIIICLNGTMPGYDALRKQCGPTSIATTRRNRALVVLCGPFWDLDAEASRIDCPIVRRNVVVHHNDDRILHNRFAALVHEIAHPYTASWTSEEMETKGLMDCVRLGAAESRKNARTYAFYAATTCIGYISAENGQGFSPVGVWKPTEIVI
ncbi:MAG: hypothetical protein Q9226_002890 [Calogaya cf. arnoldii]